MPNKGDRINIRRWNRGGAREDKRKARGEKGKKEMLGGEGKTEEKLGKEIGVGGTPTSFCYTKNQKNEMEAPVAESTHGGNSLGDVGTPGKHNPPWAFG